jgi:hypothetical protein
MLLQADESSNISIETNQSENSQMIRFSSIQMVHSVAVGLPAAVNVQNKNRRNLSIVL